MLLPIVFSNHCNLDCAYCCITNKNTSPVLSLEKAIAHIEKNKSLYGEENLEIEFFGGEPTLHWDEIKKIIDLYPNANFKIISNGMFDMPYEDVHYWKRIQDILISVDGITPEYNKGRKLSQDNLDKIIFNIQDLLEINLHTGVGIVIGNQKQLDGLLWNILSFVDLGVKYFALELVTVWEDDKPKYLTKADLTTFISAVLFLVGETILGKPKVVHIPRELISGDFYFNKLNGKSCGEGVRAISPRGNVYLCRDHAADEEGLLKKFDDLEQRPVKFIGINDKNDPLSIYQDDGNNFSQLDKHNVLTSCPVKSLQYETYANTEKLWWLSDDESFQRDIIQPLWFLTEMNNKLVRDYHASNKQIDEYYEETMNKISKGYFLLKKAIGCVSNSE